MTIQAPDIKPGYPSKGKRLGPAWRDLWSALADSGDYQDGRALATPIAIRHDLAPATLVAVLSRAALAGLLEKEGRNVISGRGNRKRTHYRIKADV